MTGENLLEKKKKNDPAARVSEPEARATTGPSNRTASYYESVLYSRASDGNTARDRGRRGRA